VTTAVDLGRLRVVGGRAPLPAVRAIALDLAQAAAATQRAESRLQRVDRPYLVPAIAGASAGSPPG